MTNQMPWANKPFQLFMGKGGVGKTTVSLSVAKWLGAQGKRVYLAHILQSDDEKVDTELKEIFPGVFAQNLTAHECFEEYVGLKLKIKKLTDLFLKSKLIRYFQKAAPGVREIVLLGKVWHELHNYDYVLVDMPSTGYGLAMIQAPYNFKNLFPGGPIYDDAVQMYHALNDKYKTAILAVTIAEEMPVQESIEMKNHISKMLPSNSVYFIFNRLLNLDPKLSNYWKDHEKDLQLEAQKNDVIKALKLSFNTVEKQKSKLKYANNTVGKENITSFSEVSELKKDAFSLDEALLP